VLLLDEPFSNLDPVLREQTRAELRDTIRRIGITTVLVTHEQEEAFDVADRIALLVEGRLQQVGNGRGPLRAAAHARGGARSSAARRSSPASRWRAAAGDRASRSIPDRSGRRPRPAERLAAARWPGRGARRSSRGAALRRPGAPEARAASRVSSSRAASPDPGATSASGSSAAARSRCWRARGAVEVDQSGRRGARSGGAAADLFSPRRNETRGARRRVTDGTAATEAPRSAIDASARQSDASAALAWGMAALLAWLVGYPLLLTLLEGARRSGRCCNRARSGWRSGAACGSRSRRWSAPAPSACRSPSSSRASSFPAAACLGNLLALPVALPPLVGVIAFLFLYGESGFAARAAQALLRLEHAPWRLHGPGAILLVHAYSMYVYFYLLCAAALPRLDPALDEAAAALGAGRWRILRRVTLAAARPALLGARCSFMTSLGSFSAPYLFGGNFRVLPTQITSSKLNGDIAQAQAETVVLAAVALLALWLFQRAEPAASGGTGVRGRGARAPALQSRGARVAATCSAGASRCSRCCRTSRCCWSRSCPPARGRSRPSAGARGGELRVLVDEPERLRPLLSRSGWRRSRPPARSLLGFRGGAARAASAGRVSIAARAPDLAALGDSGHGLRRRAAPRVQRQPARGRSLRARRHARAPAARLSRAQPAAHRPGGLAGLAQLDPALEEAAATLGAGPGACCAGSSCRSCAGARRRREHRLHHRARRFRRLDRALHLHHAADLDRNPLQSRACRISASRRPTACC
jgi:ABC-type spermidine/putrescine transport system permease subunit II